MTDASAATRRTPIPASLLETLAPRPGERRIPRLGRAAALALLLRGEEITRTTLVAEAHAIDFGHEGRKRGISEGSLDKNRALRDIYEAARSFVPFAKVGRAGAIPAQVARMTVWQLARALVLGRLATTEREAEHAKALERLAGPSDATALAALRAERATLRANRVLAEAPVAAGGRRKAGAESRAAVLKALGKRKTGEPRPRLEALAKSAGLHVSTVSRVLKEMAEEDRAEKALEIAHVPPSALLRLPHRVLCDAVTVERAYIRALVAATNAISDVVIERGLNELRLKAQGR